MDSVAYHLGLIFSRRLSTLSSKFAFRSVGALVALLGEWMHLALFLIDFGKKGALFVIVADSWMGKQWTRSISAANRERESDGRCSRLTFGNPSSPLFAATPASYPPSFLIFHSDPHLLSVYFAWVILLVVDCLLPPWKNFRCALTCILTLSSLFSLSSAGSAGMAGPVARDFPRVPPVWRLALNPI